jgi:hypothetical protein
MKFSGMLRKSQVGWGDMSKMARIMVIVPTAVITLAIFVLIGLSMRETVVTITDGQIRISGLFYGQTISVGEVAGVTLVEKSIAEMGSFSRTNGVAGLGQRVLGYFKSPEYGNVMLFAQYKTAPTIWLKRTGKDDIFISLLDGGKTREVYNTLVAATGK